MSEMVLRDHLIGIFMIMLIQFATVDTCSTPAIIYCGLQTPHYMVFTEYKVQTKACLSQGDAAQQASASERERGKAGIRTPPTLGGHYGLAADSTDAEDAYLVDTH